MTFTMSFSDFLMTSMTFVIWNQSNLLYMLVARPMQRSPLSEWGQIHFEVAHYGLFLLWDPTKKGQWALYV